MDRSKPVVTGKLQMPMTVHKHQYQVIERMPEEDKPPGIHRVSVCTICLNPEWEELQQQAVSYAVDQMIKMVSAPVRESKKGSRPLLSFLERVKRFLNVEKDEPW
jgi:hypothetical protein